MSISNHYPVTPAERLSALRKVIDKNGFARVIEAHSGLSGIIAETVESEVDGSVVEYDAFWESSLTDSATKGLPDASIVGTESRLHTINEILHVTRKPMIVDGDTGGEIPNFEFLVTSLERMGVSSVIVEDKAYPKRNSLDNSASQSLEIPEKFAEKIRAGKQVTLSDDFLIVARLESLIAGTGVEDALQRAQMYLEAGVDGIMIHSNKRDPDDLFAFVEAYKSLCQKVGRSPILVSVPTTYNQYSEKDLVKSGFNVIIHANQLLRASHKAMKEVAAQILEDGRSYDADSQVSPVKEIFQAVGFDRITEADRARVRSLRIPVIVPAAGKDPIFSDRPKSMIKVGGKRVLDFQLEAVTKAGLKRMLIVRGHEGAQFNQSYGNNENITFRDNPEFGENGLLHSLMCASEDMGDGFLLMYSDILLEHEILSRLAYSGKDIVLAVDSTYKYHTHEVDKLLDLVVTKKAFSPGLRSLRRSPLTEIVRIGKQVPLDTADSEFIGVAYFSEDGAKALQQMYFDLVKQQKGEFHESPLFESASFTDMIQELSDRGFPIHGLEVHQGWREIHTHEDVRLAETEAAEFDLIATPQS